MTSKAIILIGLFLATVLLISSEVGAVELTDAPNTIAAKEAEKTNGVEVSDVANTRGGSYSGNYGGGGNGGYGGVNGPYGGEGGAYGQGGGYSGGYGSVYGGYCRYGCCGRKLYGGGCRCCTYAGEKPDAEAQAEP